MMETLKVLELFSGIGGMHFALKDSCLDANVVAALDINNVANDVYRINFPTVSVLQNNVQSLKLETINALSPDVLLMSPPCQPFTRQGLERDILDPRSDPLIHLMKLLDRPGTSLKYILLENVKGFESSKCRDVVIKSLENAGFQIREFILSPDHSVGIPNSRLRYYLLARKTSWNIPEELHNSLPGSVIEEKCFEINKILEFSDEDPNVKQYIIPADVLVRRIQVADIVYSTSKRSCCFTKAYSRYIEGTGSVYCPVSEQLLKTAVNGGTSEDLEKLNIRFFTPREIARLMGFPEDFIFPEETTKMQQYRLLGNSINVKVVSRLISLLCDDR